MVEEARARNKERKEEWEKLLEKNKEKKAGQEKLEEKKDGRQYDITVMGTDMGKVAENLIGKIGMGNSVLSTALTVTGFDLKDVNIIFSGRGAKPCAFVESNCSDLL